MRTFALPLSALLVMVNVGSAQAQDFQEAGKHFAAAQEAFAKQHFAASAGEFQAAYDITKDSVLLYNIGEAWQKAGDGRRSVTAYRAYLRAQPNAKDRADVKKRVAMIEAKNFNLPDQSATMVAGGARSTGIASTAVAASDTPPPTLQPPPPATASPLPTDSPNGQAGARAEDNPPPPLSNQPPPTPFNSPTESSPAPPMAASQPQTAEIRPTPEPAPAIGLLDEPHPSRLRVIAWIGVATTVALLTTGAIFGLAAQSRADEISRNLTFVDLSGQPGVYDASAQSDYNNLKHDGVLYNNLAIGFFSAAGAAAVATAVLFTVDYRRSQHKDRAMRIEPSLAPGRATLSAGWSF